MQFYSKSGVEKYLSAVSGRTVTTVLPSPSSRASFFAAATLVPEEIPHIIPSSLAKSLEVDDYITSPTFTIVNEYEGKMPLYHFDVYRIGSSDEMYDIGYEDYINGEGVCIIEWANLIEDILPDEYLYIELRYKDMSREMILNPIGEKYEKIVEELTK